MKKVFLGCLLSLLTVKHAMAATAATILDETDQKRALTQRTSAIIEDLDGMAEKQALIRTLTLNIKAHSALMVDLTEACAGIDSGLAVIQEAKAAVSDMLTLCDRVVGSNAEDSAAAIKAGRAGHPLKLLTLNEIARKYISPVKLITVSIIEAGSAQGETISLPACAVSSATLGINGTILDSTVNGTQAKPLFTAAIATLDGLSDTFTTQKTFLTGRLAALGVAVTALKSKRTANISATERFLAHLKAEAAK